MRPVPVGTVIDIEGAVSHRTQAYLVAGLLASRWRPVEVPGRGELLDFAQVDDAGRPDGLPEGAGPGIVPESADWRRLDERLQKLLPPALTNGQRTNLSTCLGFRQTGQQGEGVLVGPTRAAQPALASA